MGREGRCLPPTRRYVFVPASLLVLACLSVILGCGSNPQRPIQMGTALADPRSAVRVAGVAAVGRQQSRDRVPALIDLLDDPDPAVRLTAGATLRDLTGYDTGYRPWADVVERRAHIQAWRRWWVGQTPRPIPPVLRPPPGASPTCPPATPPPVVPATPPPVVPATPPPVAPAAPGGGLPPPVIRVVRGSS